MADKILINVKVNNRFECLTRLEEEFSDVEEVSLSSESFSKQSVPVVSCDANDANEANHANDANDAKDSKSCHDCAYWRSHADHTAQLLESTRRNHFLRNVMIAQLHDLVPSQADQSEYDRIRAATIALNPSAREFFDTHRVQDLISVSYDVIPKYHVLEKRNRA